MKSYQKLILILVILPVFQLTSFGQAQNTEIAFEGSRMFSDEVLRGELEKCRFDFKKPKTDEVLKSTLSACLRGTVYDLYGKNGVWLYKLQSDIRIEPTERGKKATILIEETEPVRFDGLELENNTAEPERELIFKDKIIREFPLKKGDVVDYVALRNFYQKIKDLYFDKGYLAFDLDGRDSFSVDPETGRKTVKIRLEIFEGAPFTIESIEFRRSAVPNTIKNEALTDEFLRRTFGLNEGEVYSEGKLQAALTRLNRVGGFAELENSRKFDIFTFSSGSSTNLDIRENYDKKTAAIIIHINEPFAR